MKAQGLTSPELKYKRDLRVSTAPNRADYNTEPARKRCNSRRNGVDLQQYLDKEPKMTVGPRSGEKLAYKTVEKVLGKSSKLSKKEALSQAFQQSIN